MLHFTLASAKTNFLANVKVDLKGRHLSINRHFYAVFTLKYGIFYNAMAIFEFLTTDANDQGNFPGWEIVFAFF